MGRLRLDESDELLHLATLFCRYGYIIPVTDKSLTVKYDSTLYRFQVSVCKKVLKQVKRGCSPASWFRQMTVLLYST